MKKWFLIICLVFAIASFVGEMLAFNFEASGKTLFGFFFSFILFLVLFILAVPSEDDTKGDGMGFGGSIF